MFTTVFNVLLHYVLHFLLLLAPGKLSPLSWVLRAATFHPQHPSGGVNTKPGVFGFFWLRTIITAIDEWCAPNIIWQPANTSLSASWFYSKKIQSLFASLLPEYAAWWRWWRLELTAAHSLAAQCVGNNRIAQINYYTAVWSWSLV